MRLFGKSTEAASKYDPIRYWASRKNPNNAQGEQPSRVAFERTYIANAVSDARTILDLGPGVGRLLGAYNRAMAITSLDISRAYSTQLEDRAGHLGLTVEQRFLDNPNDRFPFEDGSFECGIVFQVFIHQPDEIFRRQFDEMCRVCSTVVVGSAVSANTGLSGAANADHVFAHDYLVAASERGMMVDRCVVREGVLYFAARSMPQALQRVWVE